MPVVAGSTTLALPRATDPAVRAWIAAPPTDGALGPLPMSGTAPPPRRHRAAGSARHRDGSDPLVIGVRYYMILK